MTELLDDAMVEVIESVFEGWYADQSRIDWVDLLDRVEAASDRDLGDSMSSPLIKAIKAHVRKLREE